VAQTQEPLQHRKTYNCGDAEIADEVAISFAHSQYDTTHIPILPRRIIRRVGM
jgi:hypothetical protein